MVQNLFDIFNFTYGNLYVCVAFVVKLQKNRKFYFAKVFYFERFRLYSVTLAKY